MAEQASSTGCNYQLDSWVDSSVMKASINISSSFLKRKKRLLGTDNPTLYPPEAITLQNQIAGMPSGRIALLCRANKDLQNLARSMEIIF
ncbi:hypothetical protein CL621_00380 [archaeon]|nr:hypothetical protein [archaeon]